MSELKNLEISVISSSYDYREIKKTFLKKFLVPSTEEDNLNFVKSLIFLCFFGM
jgi:hypothetical protein